MPAPALYRCLVCRRKYQLLIGASVPRDRHPMCCGMYLYQLQGEDTIPDGGALELLYANPDGVDQRVAWRVPWGRA